ncbi:hypothetical protein RB623_06715 [Mesorhizobium sp. LHD-90]|uniref:hypothetical protein n=1 Tax=Mesorhizobium sp. LHD-90 TaxID=3071414 RepID=UPI0027E1666C|nr:hypothetical protein [Mesorhizobium sp. LHD-90]MDQ6433742.1 hypothetical protein [Mesorhizobium sp. LHD-90]
MPPSKPDRAPPGAGRQKPAARRSFSRLWRGRNSSSPLLARRRRSDLIVAGLGIALGFGCAVFPWYIFFNQDKFGIRALKFEGNPDQKPPVMLGSDGERIGAPMTAEDIPPMQLDLFATGTVGAGADGQEEEKRATEALDQPFPGDAVAYRLVYAAAGRAMIADDSGMWVVQRGSLLPDNSKVAGIEQRAGKWVLITSNDKVVELEAM